MTFRRRILAAMVPLFVLLIVLGATGSFLINQLGKKVDDILQDNYDSVVYMRDLNKALERIDSSFQFALAGREKQSFKQYQKNWALYAGKPGSRAAQHHACPARKNWSTI